MKGSTELFKRAVVMAALLSLLVPDRAHAYFDLGTGTYIIQLVLGFGAAFWLSFRQSWFGNFFSKKQKVAADTKCDATGHQASPAEKQEPSGSEG